MNTNLKVILLEHTPNPDQVITASAKLCYSDKPVTDILDNVTKNQDNTAKFIKMLADLGHESPFEHVMFTFGIEGVSRTLTHQLVRHRIASYSQKSQRYVKEHDFGIIIPPSISINKNAENKVLELKQEIQKLYDELVNTYNIPAEDARYILPNATETSIIVSMNARSLINFFNHRCCMRAQWEIRALANQMLKLVKEVAPNTFKSAGASCKKLGYCVEGKMSCGAYPTLDKIKNIKGGY